MTDKKTPKAAEAASDLNAELGVWKPTSQKPPIAGESYLVALKEDNSFGYTHERPIIAEFGYYKSSPDKWSIFNYEGCENEIADDDDILYWMELPKIPKTSFLKHLKKCKDAVDNWPQWKKDVLKSV